MAVNESIYGSKTDWNRMTGTDFADTAMNYYYANFGNQSTYDSSFLQAGVDNGKITLNEPIDKSLSWCGLGSNSTFSNLECYNNRPWEDANDAFKMINKDARTVTNFAIFGKIATGGPVNSSPSYWNYSDTSSTTYASRSRWSPEATTGTSSSTRNFNMGLRPVTQIPMRNCVLVPFVECVESIDAVLTGAHNVAMWDYLNPESTYNYTNCPYILTVTMQTWGNIDDNDSTTNARSNRWVSTQRPHIAVLDETDACRDQPFNTLVPGYKQSGTYQYYAMGSIKGIDGMVIMGTLSSNNRYMLLPHSKGSDSQTRGNLVLPHPDGQLKYLLNTSTGVSAADRVLYYVTYYDGFQEWVRCQIACFGLFFTDDEATAQYGDFDAENMFLGTLDGNNVGNGHYTHGADNRSQKQWNWSTTNDSDYNPQAEIDKNVYGRDWGFNAVSLADSTVRRYVMSDAELANFGKYLWDVIDTQNPDELIQNQTLTNFLTNNPLDCVVSLKRFPFADMSQASNVNIVLGKVTVPNVVGRPFTSDAVVRSCGEKKIYPLFEDWRDYICDYFLYLPFCGTLKLDAETVVGRKLYVYYAIDYTTGTCTAYVTTRDDDGAEFYLDSASGNCAIDIPLSGVETATLTGEIYNANENLKALKFNGIVGAAQGALNIAGAASSGSKLAAAGAGLQAGAGIVNAIHDVATADWNIQHTQIPLKMVGASSGCNSLQGELTPCIIRYYPITDTAYNEENYLHTVGAACCESNTIGNYSGYAEIVNADLSGIAATADEINMIKNLLAKGVYL